MRKEKFTPKPWTRDFGQPDWIESSAGSIAIVGVDSKISDEEDSANAALIIAAPDLYEALQSVILHLDAIRSVTCGACGLCDGDIDNADCGGGDAARVINRANAVLKKARGES